MDAARLADHQYILSLFHRGLSKERENIHGIIQRSVQVSDGIIVCRTLTPRFL